MAEKILPYLGGEDVEGHIRGVQEEMLQRMVVEPTKSILQASEMGVGKTLLAVEFVLRMGLKRVLFVGVKDSFAQFKERLEAQSDGAATLRRIDATKPGEKALADFLAGEDGLFFAGSEMLTARNFRHETVLDDDGRPVWKRRKTTGEVYVKLSKKIGPRLVPQYESRRIPLNTYRKMRSVDLIVYDEVHKIADRKSVGRKTIFSIKTEWKIAMSGTWFGNSAENMWSITRWLWPDLIEGRFGAWRERWCETETVYVKGGKETLKTTGERNPGAFAASLPLYLRVEGDEQPPAAQIVKVELSAKQRDQYDEMERQLLLWVERHGKLDVIVRDLPIAMRSALRTIALGEVTMDNFGEMAFAEDCESSKLRALRGVLDFWGDQRVAVYTHSKQFAKVAVARMRKAGLDVAEWSGDVPSKHRDEIKADFLAGRVQYLVCVIGAFREALDGFQAVCNKIVWLSEQEGDDVANSQALARFFRPGRKVGNGGFQHVTIQAVGTHDEGVYGALLAKHFTNKQTLRIAA